MRSIDETPCDLVRLEMYLDNASDAEREALIEEHLCQCQNCAEKIQRMAADCSAWKNASDFLPTDQYDDHDAIETLAGLSSADTNINRSRNNQTLEREIRGWLDPTDDPRMIGRFAGYEIVGIIGHGGMGIVLKGFERSLNRYVAIKVLAPRLATNATARRRFAREAQAAAAVLHENVVAIHRVDEVHDLPFLVMPYFAGESLQQRIERRGPLTLEATLRIGIQIAQGLSAAHAQGLVHRDIKPANVLLEPGIERVQITDFGLARAVDDGTVTRTGFIAGTPEYMSPEQASGVAIDSRSDLFSLGSVLQACLTGRSPFCGESATKAIERVRLVQKKTLRESDASLPVWVEELIGKLHEKNPRHRFQDAQSVADVLEQCALHVQSSDRPLPSSLVYSSAKQNTVLLLSIFVTCAVVIWSMWPMAPGNVKPTSTKTTTVATSVSEMSLKEFQQVDASLDLVETELNRLDALFLNPLEKKYE